MILVKDIVQSHKETYEEEKFFGQRSELTKYNDEKSLKCGEAIDDLNDSLHELYAQQFELIVKKWENQERYGRIL